jgi:hypothetical protein
MADVYYTENSAYVIDLEGKRYKRFDRSNKGSPARTGGSPRLEYGEWLPLKDVENPVRLVAGGLHIWHESSTIGILTSEVEFIVQGVDSEFQP